MIYQDVLYKFHLEGAIADQLNADQSDRANKSAEQSEGAK